MARSALIRRIVTLSVAALALSLISGCSPFTTHKVWGWAAMKSPRSRARCVQRDAKKGEVRIVYRLKGKTERPRGWYALAIPSDWRTRPVRPDPLGGDIVELAPSEKTTFAPAAAPPAKGREKPLRLRSWQVRGGVPPERTGGDGTAYGVLTLRDEGRFVDEVYGYDRANSRWVRLGVVRLDPGACRPGRIFAACLTAPFTLSLDAVVCVTIAVGYVMSEGGGTIYIH